MTCNNVILAQPQAEGSVSYTIPEGDSARLNFGPEDISGLRVGDSGQLVISFENGGELTIENFQELIDSDSLIYLADGTLIDPSVLTSSLQAPEIFNAIESAAGDSIAITQPTENTKQEISLVEGQKYICDFDPENAALVEIKDGQMVLTFADGSQIILNNYSEMMAGELPPELTLADGSVIDGEALLTEVIDIENLDEDVASIEPASGEAVEEVMGEEDMAALAEQLAEVAPAAGETGGGASNSGYGFNSKPVEVLLDSPDALGPLDPTRLQYNAPQAQVNNALLQAVDDRPIVSAAIELLDETDFVGGSLVATGNLQVNYGNDSPGVITVNGQTSVVGSLAGGSLSSGGVPVVITSTPIGYIGVAGGVTVFTFEITSGGAYTYTQLQSFDHADSADDNDVISINFGVVATDIDGDRTSSTVHVEIADDAPIILSQVEQTVDETDSNAGNITVNGQFNADLGQDVAANGYAGNGNFVTSGSLANGTLSSGGVAVSVTLVGNVYTGSANGVTVFTLTLDTDTGEYTYQQFEALDHGNPNDPNDQLTLQFGVEVTDFDGDAADGFITVNVLDDAPEIIVDSGSVDETDMLVAGPVTISSNINYGADGAGSVAPNGSFSFSGSVGGVTLTSAGEAVVVTQTASGYVGIAGGRTIFTFETSSQSGEYSFTLLDVLDHGNPNDPDDIINLYFGIDAKDSDGDTASQDIQINIHDDGPSLESSTENTTIVTTGNIDLGSGVSVVDTTLTPNGINLEAPFTSNGIPIITTVTGGIVVGTANGVPVFEIEVLDDGTFTFTQLGPIDQGDSNNPVAINTSVDVEDSNGNVTTQVITINVDNIDPSTPQTGVIDLGSGVVIVGTTVTDTDVDNPLTSNGVPIVITLVDDTYVGTANGVVIFEIEVLDDGSFTLTQFDEIDQGDVNNPITINIDVVVEDNNGNITTHPVVINVDNNFPDLSSNASIVAEDPLESGSVTLSSVINFGGDGPGAATPTGEFQYSGSVSNWDLTSSGADVTVTLSGNTYIGTANGAEVFRLEIDPVTGDYTFVLSEPLDHADGSDPQDLIELQFGMLVTDSEGDGVNGFISIFIQDGAPVISNVTRSIDEGNLETGPIVETGTIDHNFNADGAGEVTTTGDFDASGSVDNGILSHNGVTITVTATSNGYIGVAGALTVFTLDIDPLTGEYTFTQFTGLDHADNNDANDVITLTFGAEITDYDGDMDTANIVINVADSAVTFQGGGPQPDSGLETVDETDLSGGSLVETGSLGANFGADGPGTYAGISSKTPTGLTHDGETVTVTFDANTNTFTGLANGSVVFTLVIDAATGDYTYTQHLPLDHPDGSDANDALTLEFGVNAFDSEGESAEGAIVIDVLDDGPDAVNDSSTIREGNTLTGNVVDNDELGADGLGAVTQVVFNNVTTAVPTTGTIDVTGIYGTLTIGADGSYSYAPNSNDPDGVDNFTYLVRDGDGDVDEAVLSINVSPDFAPTDISGTGATDDSALASGPDVETGTINVNYNGDGPGTTTGNGSFSADGSFQTQSHNGGAGNQTSVLSHNGTAITVSFASGTNTYTGTAGGVTVFTMTINSNGTYNFTQYENLDHGNTNSDNEAITLDFGVTATDSDGDTGNGIVTITVRDDGPEAVDDVATIGRNQTSVSGNITDNDSFGADGNGGDFTPGTYNGTFGSLVLSADGSYTYTRFGNGGGTDVVDYTICDREGDLSSATLTLTVVANNSPIDITGSGATDDTALTSGPDVETGTINVNTQGDGFGATEGNGNFSSGGSQLGGSLTHNGIAVNVSFNAGSDTYTGTAGGQTIFTMKINDNGTYRFVQHETIDHGNANSNNEAVTLRFGVRATDADGDSGNGSVTITVRDDGPNARNDSLRVTGNSGRGNVLSNDDAGEDAGATVLRFNVNGRWYNVGQEADTALGTIKVNANGAYTVTDRASPVSSTTTSVTRETEVTTQGWGRDQWTQTQAFDVTTRTTTTTVAGGNIRVTYEMSDGDGDRDTAVLNVNLAPISNTTRTQTRTPVQVWGGGDGGGDGGGGTPLVLDLDGDGIEMTSIEGGVLFDIGSDGDLDRVAWVQADDGLLALDVNKDGEINNQSELFGTLDVDGFHVLAEHDSNNDGVINADDEVFDDLLVWQDLNQDGISQEGELKTLSEHGITSINLVANATDYYLEGSWVAYDSSFTYEDGSTGQISDVWFKYIDEAVWNNLIEHLGEDAATEWLANAYSTVSEFLPSSTNDDWQPGDPLVLGSIHKVYEAGLNDSIVSQEGELTVFYGDDEPGNIQGNGSFQVGGSLLNGALTSHGDEISVTYDAETGIYFGSTANEDIFNLQVNEDGSYTFNLFDSIDHGNNVNLDDNILLQFGVTVTDADGDTTESTIRLQVRDAGSYLSDDIDGDTDIDSFANGDVYGADGVADSFMFQTITESATTLHDFDALEGDIVDLSALIDSGDDVTEAISDFVYVTEEDGDAIISVDVDGAGGPAGAVEVVRLEGISGVEAQDLIDTGSIVI